MKRYIKIFSLLTLVLIGSKTQAQINPLDAQYFQNTYLANPALAGSNGGLRLNLGYRNQWSDIPGSPKTQNLMLDYRANNAGLGLAVYNEKSGDLSYTKVVGTYAYHLKLNDNGNALHFGFNLGFSQGDLNTQNMVGNPNDPDVNDFNNRKAVWDGDFGLAFSSKRFSLEGAFYNIKTQTKNEVNTTADYGTYFFAASYSVPLKNWDLNTKLAYRGVNNYVDITDIGLELVTQDKKLGFSTIYHTSKSTSFGLSYLYKQHVQLVGFYNTSSKPIGNYTNGSFEMGVQYLVHKAKK